MKTSLSLLVLTLLSLLNPISAQDGFNATEYGMNQAKYLGKTYKASADGLPDKTQTGQTGTNKCGTKSSEDSMCQNLYINSITDFSLYAPATSGQTIGDVEADVVTYATKAGRGTRVMPLGTITGATVVTTPNYIQITGVGDFTKINVQKGDDGGELDYSGATGLGNPIGDLVFVCTGSKGCSQRHRWMMFMADTEFCVRVCNEGPQGEKLCRHTYDTLGCAWNMPGDYNAGTFQQCESTDAPDVAYHNGQYFKPGSTPVPEPYAAPPNKNCKTVTELELYGTVSGDVFGPADKVKVTPLDTSKAPPTSNTTDGDPTASGGPSPPSTGSIVPDSTSNTTSTNPTNTTSSGGGTVVTPGSTNSTTDSAGSSTNGTDTAPNAAASVNVDGQKVFFAALAGALGVFIGCALI